MPIVLIQTFLGVHSQMGKWTQKMELINCCWFDKQQTEWKYKFNADTNWMKITSATEYKSNISLWFNYFPTIDDFVKLNENNSNHGTELLSNYWLFFPIEWKHKFNKINMEQNRRNLRLCSDVPRIKIDDSVGHPGTVR